jgi:Ran GTPase-activating protein (RanGAP) involved in mRNA processing and transport
LCLFGSEGKSLSHNDAKTYWGVISHVPDDTVVDEETKDMLAQDVDSPSSSDDDAIPKRLQVIGSVLIGWGLEPLPEARFHMKESSTEELEQEEDDDDDEEEEDTTEEDLERTFEKNEGQDDIDWSTAFQ